MKRARVSGLVVTFLLAYATYILYTGSISLYDVVMGAVVALIAGILFSGITVKNPAKIANPVRLVYLLAYAIKYFLYYETLAHLDVIARILHPQTPVNPAIVKAPFHVKTDFGITAVANSITNTPGTVVVEVDEEEKVFYIHWIDAKTLEPTEVRRRIFEDFEKYVRKVFD